MVLAAASAAAANNGGSDGQPIRRPSAAAATANILDPPATLRHETRDVEKSQHTPEAEHAQPPSARRSPGSATPLSKLLTLLFDVDLPAAGSGWPGLCTQLYKYALVKWYPLGVF